MALCYIACVFNKDDIIAVLKTVEDPELYLDIWFLGLVYNIDIAEDVVKIEMTFTTPMCPYGPTIVEQVQERVGQIAGVKKVEVVVTFTPPWEPSDEVKGLLGMM